MEYVYVIGENSGPMKVGFSTNPRSRVADIQSTYPRPMRFRMLIHVPDGANGITVEQAVHAKLSEHRLNGEWFAVDESQVETAVCSVVEEFGPPALMKGAGWEWPSRDGPPRLRVPRKRPSETGGRGGWSRVDAMRKILANWWGIADAVVEVPDKVRSGRRFYIDDPCTDPRWNEGKIE